MTNGIPSAADEENKQEEATKGHKNMKEPAVSAMKMKTKSDASAHHGYTPSSPFPLPFLSSPLPCACLRSTPSPPCSCRSCSSASSTWDCSGDAGATEALYSESDVRGIVSAHVLSPPGLLRVWMCTETPAREECVCVWEECVWEECVCGGARSWCRSRALSIAMKELMYTAHEQMGDVSSVSVRIYRD